MVEYSLSLALYAMVIFCGAFVQGTLGFGLAIVASPILYWLNPALVPGPVIALALSVALVNLIRYRRTLTLNGLRGAIGGLLPGALLGGYLLTVISGNALSILLGSMVLVAVVVSMGRIRLSVTPVSLAVAGFLSGMMGTATAISGPPMALVMQHEPPDRIRATLSGFYVICCALSLTILYLNSYFGVQQLRLAWLLLPAALLGSLTANYLSRFLSQAMLRQGVLGLCSVCGVMALVSALR